MLRASRGRNRQQRPPQALAGTGVEKGLVPAFACRHDPVLAKGAPRQQSQRIARVRTSSKPRILSTARRTRRRALREPAPAAEIRHDWTAAGGARPAHPPLLDLVDAGARGASAPPRRRRGAARKPAVDQDRRLPRGLQILRAVGALRQGHRARSARRCSTSTTCSARRALAKAAGATRFCMGAAWREVKDGPSLRQRARHGPRRRARSAWKPASRSACSSQAQADRLARGRAHRLQPQSRYLARILRRDRHHAHLPGPPRHARARAGGRQSRSAAAASSAWARPSSDRAGLLETLANLDPHPESVPINALMPRARHAARGPAAGRSARSRAHGGGGAHHDARCRASASPPGGARSPRRRRSFASSPAPIRSSTATSCSPPPITKRRTTSR